MCSVSYTHLDVYKRQIINFVLFITKSNQFAWFSFMWTVGMIFHLLFLTDTLEHFMQNIYINHFSSFVTFFDPLGYERFNWKSEAGSQFKLDRLSFVCLYVGQ